MQNAKLQFKIQNLRRKYPKFIYQNYFYKISGENLEIFFEILNFEGRRELCPLLPPRFQK